MADVPRTDSHALWRLNWLTQLRQKPKTWINDPGHQYMTIKLTTLAKVAFFIIHISP